MSVISKYLLSLVRTTNSFIHRILAFHPPWLECIYISFRNLIISKKISHITQISLVAKSSAIKPRPSHGVLSTHAQIFHPLIFPPPSQNDNKSHPAYTISHQPTDSQRLACTDLMLSAGFVKTKAKVYPFSPLRDKR